MRSGLRNLAFGLIALVVLAPTGCGSGAPALRGGGIEAETRQVYLNGLVELEAGNYLEAIRHFQQVAASPSYFRYTALASLRLADALFHQEQYARAIEAYQGFIKRFAGNPNIPYAEFRVAQSYYRRLPGDWWFMPPAYEKDLSSTRAAYDSLSRYLARYPRHQFAPMAHRMREFAGKRLFEFELYVADFYEDRDKPRGVTQRLESALEQFPARAADEEVYVRLARAYADAGDPQGTRSALQRYLAAFPEGRRSEEVRSWLDALTQTAPEGEASDDVPDDDSEEDSDDDPDETPEPGIE